ncbi:DUF5670 family protein [Sinomonas sp. G460-2]
MLLFWASVILFVLWVLGVIVDIGGGVHLLLFIAIITFIVFLVGRRRPA